MNKIPPTNKTKILIDTKEDIDKENEDDDGDYEDIMYQNEKEAEYLDATLVILQKSLLEVVDKKSLTLCEYLTVDSISQYLGYS
jgi:hypothetical protein